MTRPPARVAALAAWLALGCAAAALVALVWRSAALPAAILAALVAVLALQQAGLAAAAWLVRRRAADAARRRDALLARMSHALRTPMNGILGTTDLLLETRPTPEQAEALGVVKSSAEALLATLTNLLDDARSRAGRLELDAATFDLRAAVHDAVREQAPRAHRKGIELASAVGPEVPHKLRGDRRRLQQVLRNLLDNAITHTGEGEVVVRVRAESLTDAEVRLAFEVADTGTGMSAERREQVMRAIADGRFVESPGEGLGLGLAVSAALVRHMGGALALAAPPGGGAVCRFTARLALDPETAAWPPPASGLDLCERAVLLVDDNATTRALLGDAVRSWRGNPIAAGGASEALSALERACRRGRLPALAIVDLDMPGMPGGVLVDMLAADDRLAAVPVIAITSPGEGGRPEAPRGCAATVAKPILEAELREAARAALARGDDRPRDVADARAVPEPVAPPAAPRLRVLVADDNRVDRTLAVRLLEKAGHAVSAVESGEQAIQTCASRSFDVLLMDVQMPHVSGLDATAAIRARERRTGEHLPIIALTADDDSARCLEAGMDAYLAKPVHPREMAEAIALATGAADPGGVAKEAATGEGPLDVRLALAQAGGDRSLLVDLVQMCLADGPVALERIREALAERDAAAVRRTAHKLRGSLLVLAATPAARAAQHLEVLCAQGRLERARAAAAVLEQELERLRPELGGILGAAAASADAKRPRTPSAAIAHLDS